MAAAEDGGGVYAETSFSELEELWRVWDAKGEEEAKAAPPRVSLRGYVVSLRQMSAKLFFFDLLEDVDRPDQHAEGLVRMGRAGATKADIAAHRTKCTVTNEVRIKGALARTHRGGMVVEVVDVELLRSFDTQPEAVGNTRTMKRHAMDTKEDQELIKKIHQHVSHLSRSAAKQQIGVEAKKPPLCKAWWKGRCQKGPERCEFRHEFLTEEERQRYEAAAARSKQDKAEYAHDDDPHEGDKRSHNLRATLFADWLVETFGRDHMSKGSGVLDIAGGAGAVSFELHVRRAVPCTLIDPRAPRAMKHHRHFLKQMFKKFKRQDAAAAAAAVPEGGAPPAEGANDELEPAGKRRKVEEGAAPQEADGGEKEQTQAEEEDPRRQQHDMHLKGGVGTEAADDAHFRALYAEAGGDFRATLLKHRAMMVEACPETLDDPMFQDSALMIGMHPDQATCPIIDTALALNKPFVVVPCCVFPKLFPDRRTADGEPVKTYPQYLDYILRKDSRLRTAYLPFKGRNCAIYLHPDDVGKKPDVAA
eukprot:TRINITY_DN24544_c0_g1_i1.p1 TRINITY_DN24544_c0_g1~~TRINITY_DN24544_c0_g1_i1.p1  ORF type:complete len:551 (+),score=211.76 TRINITY_DN24544_c0_g1_i1:56-1654(+)